MIVVVMVLVNVMDVVVVAVMIIMVVSPQPRATSLTRHLLVGPLVHSTPLHSTSPASSSWR